MKIGEETIQLKGLNIGYHTKRGIRLVAGPINGVIRSGELTCLLGANGVGKSTLLRTLAAFQPKVDGEVFIEGRSLSDFSDKELSRLIGVVLTEKPDVRNMTVRELVCLGRSPFTGFWGTYSKEDLRVVDESLALVGIEALSCGYRGAMRPDDSYVERRRAPESDDCQGVGSANACHLP